MKIYLDNCCYNRPFDDLTVGGNELEANAKMFIQSLVKYKSLSLCSSFMSLFEISESPKEENKRQIIDFIINNTAVFVSQKSKDKAEPLVNTIMQTGIKKKDAVHLACAIISKCDFFITTDKRVLKYKTDRIQIVNPIKFAKLWGFYNV